MDATSSSKNNAGIKRRLKKESNVEGEKNKGSRLVCVLLQSPKVQQDIVNEISPKESGCWNISFT